MNVKEKWKRWICWNLNTSGVYRDLDEFYLVFLPREIDVKMCQRYTKTYIYKMKYRNQSFKQILQIRNESENYDNPEEPKQLRYAPIIIWIYYLVIFNRFNG